MTAVMALMSCIAKALPVKTEPSNVSQDIALLHTSVATVIATVVTCQTKLIVHLDSPAAGTVPKQDSNATTTSAFPIRMFAMDLMTVETIPTKLQQCAQI
jgi:hypothetical protein